MLRLTHQQIVLAFFFLAQSLAFTPLLLAPLLAGTQKFSSLGLGLLLSSMTFTAATYQPLLGRWIDQGRRFLAGMVVAFGYSVGILVFIREDRPLFLLIIGAIVVTIAGSTLRTLSSTALLSSIPDARRGEIMARRYLIANAAIALSAGVALWGLKNHREMLLLGDWLMTMTLTSVCLWILKRPQSSHKVSPEVAVPIRRVLGDVARKHGHTIAGLMLISIVFGTHLSYLSMLFAKLNLSPTESHSVMLLTNTLLVVAGVPLVKRLTKAWPSMRRGAIGASLLAAGFALMPWVESLPVLIGSTVIWTVGEIFYIPWQIEKIYACFDGQKAGLSSGGVSFIFSATSVAAPLLSAGLLAIPKVFASLAFFGLPLFGLYWVYRSESRFQRMKMLENAKSDLILTSS